MSGGRRRILVMDDSALSLDVTCFALERQGFEVACARDLHELERELQVGRPDLVLMDVEMPEAQGDEVADWLRVAHALEAPVYLLSGLPADELERRVNLAGLDGYILKSDGLEAVVQRACAVLRDDGPSPAGPSAGFLPALAASGRRRLHRLRRLVESGLGDKAALRAELHTLAGEAALLGCQPVLAAVRRLQQAALGPAASREAAQEAVEGLAGELDALADGTAPAVGSTRAAPSGRRILLLDDSDFYRTTLMALLEERGHEVVEARSLSEARQRLHDGSYQLAILDVHLEEGAGGSLLPEIRQAQPGARLVVVTGEEPGPAAPASDLVVEKTTPAGELLSAIERLLA